MVNKVAILAWGSLITNPGNLSEIIDEWKQGGPMLPIEFARKSNDGRLTLVIFNDYINKKERWIQAQWCFSKNLFNNTVSILAQREKCLANRIGVFYPKKDFKSVNEIEKSINSWGIKKEIDVIIWTNLVATFHNENEILNYISLLKGDILVKAKDYIFSTPLQTNTYLRKKIEEKLVDKISSL